MSSTSSSVPTTTSATSARKTKEEIQKLISSSPELRDNIYALLATTVASVEAQQPSDVKAKDTKIEQLQVQLLEALNYGNDKARRVEELEASLKVATDTGLSQIETLEEIHNKLKGQQETEKNLRRGNMALTKQMDPLKVENAKLKRQLKDAEKEIALLKEKYDYQGQTLELLSQKARQTERINMRIEDDLTKLERENKLLVLKGEQMSGKLLAVAEQWHGPGLGGRKRQAEEVLDDGEKERRFARMTR
jgi:chromosome segregation ATPase